MKEEKIIMAKGWTTVGEPINKGKHKTYNKSWNFNDLIRNTKSLSIEDLKKRSEEIYDKEIAEENKLLSAFNEKILKSKTAINKALRIKKERAAAAKRNKKVAEQNTDTASEDKTNEVTESIA